MVCFIFFSWSIGFATDPLDNWQVRNSGTTNWLRAVAYGDGKFVAAGPGSGPSLTSTVLYSTDGKNWTSENTSVFFNDATLGLDFLNNVFIATGYNSGIVTSPDGLTWTMRYGGITDYADNYWFFQTAYGDGMYIAAATSNLLMSQDLVTWTEIPGAAGLEFNSIMYANGTFIATLYNPTPTGYGYGIYTSSNGKTWRFSFTNELNSFAFGNGKFVGVGNGGVIIYSADAVTWFSANSGTTSDLQRIIFAENIFLAVGSNGTIISSPDGINWTSHISGLSSLLSGVIYGNNSFVVVGENGTIIQASVYEEVAIDIEPWFKPNIIDWKFKWPPIPVAILSKPAFDAPKMIDGASLTFGDEGNENSLAFCSPLFIDVNGDRLRDLICFFYTGKTSFLCGDTEGILKGKTKDGTPIEGSDSVKIVPCK